MILPGKSGEVAVIIIDEILPPLSCLWGHVGHEGNQEGVYLKRQEKVAVFHL